MIKKVLIHNNDVAWEFLKWKKEAGKLTEEDKHNLALLNVVRIKERLDKLNDLLKGIGGIRTDSQRSIQIRLI